VFTPVLLPPICAPASENPLRAQFQQFDVRSLRPAPGFGDEIANLSHAVPIEVVIVKSMNCGLRSSPCVFVEVKIDQRNG